MKRKEWIVVILAIAVFLAVLPAVAYGQGNGQGSGQGGPPATPPGQGTGPGQQPPPSTPPPTATPSPNKVFFEGSGVITDVLAAVGTQYPAILFTPTSSEVFEVLLAPMWFLEDLGLTEEVLAELAGKTAYLVAFDKITDDVGYHAISIEVDGTEYVFRTEDGKQLWNGSGKKPKDRTAATPGLLAGSARELGGEVKRVVESLATGEMVMWMLGDDGLQYRIRLGPAEDLLAGGVMLHERNRVTVRFALEEQTRGAVALQLMTEAMMTVRLRDDNGVRLGPNWE